MNKNQNTRETIHEHRWKKPTSKEPETDNEENITQTQGRSEAKGKGRKTFADYFPGVLCRGVTCTTLPTHTPANYSRVDRCIYPATTLMEGKLVMKITWLMQREREREEEREREKVFQSRKVRRAVEQVYYYFTTSKFVL